MLCVIDVMIDDERAAVMSEVRLNLFRTEEDILKRCGGKVSALLSSFLSF